MDIKKRDCLMFIDVLSGDTLQAVSERNGISRERVRQIIWKLARMIRGDNVSKIVYNKAKLSDLRSEAVEYNINLLKYAKLKDINLAD